MRNQTRLILMGIFLAVLTGAGALFWVVTERLSADAATEQIDDILDSTEQTALATIATSVDNIERVEGLLADLAADPERGGANPEWAMVQALEFVPELSGLFLANDQGDFRFVFRSDDGFGTKQITTDADGQGTREVRFVDLDENLVETSSRLDTEDTYDPRTRPWYQEAMVNPGESIWTDPYVFFTSQQPGITRAVASADPSASWVVGADIQLGSLVLLLGELSDENSGEVFLFDGEQTALTRTGLVSLGGEATDLDRRLRAALGAGTGGSDDAKLDRIEYEIDGEPHTSRFTPLPLGGGSWSLVTDLADADVAIPVSGIVRASQLLALVISAIATLALAFLLIPATNPIHRLERDATVDALTALPNRRTILQSGQAESERDGALGVAMIDVDKFKLVNDTHGHFVGDETLRGLAQRFVESGHEVGRLGGEEFVALLRTDPDDMAAAAEELRLTVAGSPVMTAAGPIDVTISIGVAAHQPGESFADALKRADQALLEAKSQGRDRVVSRAPESAPTLD